RERKRAGLTTFLFARYGCQSLVSHPRWRCLPPTSLSRSIVNSAGAYIRVGGDSRSYLHCHRPLIIFQISCRISCWDVSPTNRSFPERLISAGARSPTAAICIGSLLTCHSATGPGAARIGTPTSLEALFSLAKQVLSAVRSTDL